jgi:hypothetical protein
MAVAIQPVGLRRKKTQASWKGSRARKLHCEVPVREATKAAHIFILATPRQFGAAFSAKQKPRAKARGFRT